MAVDLSEKSFLGKFGIPQPHPIRPLENSFLISVPSIDKRQHLRRCSNRGRQTGACGEKYVEQIQC